METMTELDINEIVKDDKSFKLYVVMTLDQDQKTMESHAKQLAGIAVDGCPKYGEVSGRVTKIEKQSKAANRLTNLVSVIIGALGGKGAEFFGR